MYNSYLECNMNQTKEQSRPTNEKILLTSWYAELVAAEIAGVLIFCWLSQWLQAKYWGKVNNRKKDKQPFIQLNNNDKVENKY